MRRPSPRPSPVLSADERRLLEAVAKHGGHPPSVPVLALRSHLGITTMELARLAWSLQDPRRFTADLLFIDRRFDPELVRLTPEGLDVAAGAEPPIEPKLLRFTPTSTAA